MLRKVWISLLWAFDWLDHDGEPDNGKIMQGVVVYGLLAAALTTKSVSVPMAVTLVIASNGTRAVLAAIKSGVWSIKAQVTDTTTTTHATTHQITERRDPDAGYEASP